MPQKVTEKWGGPCPSCRGRGEHHDPKQPEEYYPCMRCNGSGYDSSAENYMRIEQAISDQSLPPAPIKIKERRD
jgi:DnaJ-class molecular chaperone